ncbi:uncharacterized protein LOC129759791 [Uranotaenia lowii]|uniref:uncharacterized protein LOC129759791 n=1 Tax=Uranotaenia lowii TaxID=190385 RepID=UPI00247A7719|nr:uncharacterized protein LOC129759791 [Uranotaenia lowii]
MSKTRSKTSVLRGLLATFSGIFSFMERYNEDRDSGELAVRLEKLDPLWEKVEEAFTEVEDADGEAGGEENRYVKDRLDFQNKFFELKAFLTSRIRMCSEISAALPTHESTIITSSHPHVKLPLISLPKFSGNVEDWLAFRDLFLSLIHHSPDLPMIEKFHYLRSQLEGEALSVISSLALTQSNYMIAWDLLVARYSNNKVLKKRQVQNIFDLPVLRKESATDLYKLVEGFDKATKVLDQVIQASDYKDLLLIHVLSSRLDDKTRRSWEEHSSTMEEETLKDFVEFLRRRIHILDSLPTKTIEPTQSLNRKSNHIKVASHGAVQLPSESWKCICCSESHPLHTCPVFGRLPVEEREKRLRLQSLCRNCFRRGHRAQECSSKFSCRRCKGRHHTLVCFKAEEGQNSQRVKSGGPRIGQAVNDGASTSGGNEAQRVASNVVRTAQKILLATAIVWVQDDSGRKLPARALLDSGSECNIISTSLSQRLRIQRGRVQVQISGVGQVPTNTKERVRATIQSLQSDYSQPMEFYVLPKVTEDLPTSNISISTWRLPEEIKLADPDFFKSNPIDLLLGGEHFFCFFPTKQRIQLGEGLPMLVHSVFGWLVTGRCGVSSGEAPILCQHSSISQSLERLMSKFWEIEEGRSSSKYSVEETRCEENFIETVKRADDGRYKVGLPKSPEAVARLGDSKSAALRRLLQLERRLGQNESLKSEYNDFMSEYLSHGHMKRIMEPIDNIPHFYLPHHPVIKASSTTTRVRVVFDASAKSTNGISLNDALLNGPVIQDDLRTLIIRSRFFPIILIADVEKMFRQVWIDAADLPLQRILWRFSPTDPIDTFELLTVTYGTKPAPFLATRVLKQLSLDEAENYPLAAKRLGKDVYMDDVITGAMDVDEAKVLRKQLDDLTQSGGFRLRKWVSNIPAALEGISEDNLAFPFGDGIDFEAEKTVKTLGLVWDPKTDTFRFNLEFSPDSSETLTKRVILSRIAKIFDPLGMFGPVVTRAKLFMQEIWLLKNASNEALGWDDNLPEELVRRWTKFYSLLPKLQALRIPRFVGIYHPVSSELHFFSDASEAAYGACVYLRSQDDNGQVTVSITSRSRVSLLKKVTIPRLELCGAFISAELLQRITEAMNIPYTSYFWTDSRTVLQWLAQPPSTWSTFVANRVSFIQNTTQNSHWHHVPGVLNPADQLSRGLDPELVIHDEAWWNGPPWLAQEKEFWPRQSDSPPEAENIDLERKRISNPNVISPNSKNEFSDWYFSQFTDYTKLVRATAYFRRFLKYLRTPDTERINSTPLLTQELHDAEHRLVRMVQKDYFPQEYCALQKGDAVHRSSKLRWYVPRLDKDGIIRVGGRLQNSEQPEDAKHPMVIPGKHPFAELLADCYHRRLLHAGCQLLLSTIRLKFWPLGGRDLCRKVIHKCLICFRAKPNLQQQFMSQLPKTRITISKPFTNTGVDYFGPVYIRQGFRKGPVKAYVAVFVCFATKAVHLELVSDQSTPRFIQALRRFIARRGKCCNMYSDNGTNFVGARNTMKELIKMLKTRTHHDEIQNECIENGINWHFIPPGSPHFGGLWEAAVRSAKKHLLRVLGTSSASQEDYITLLAQVEACLNSRPLTQLTDDPTDLEPLTPGHFLIGSSMQALPDEELSSVPENRLNQLQLKQQQLDRFWRRWSTEYLTQLQARVKNWQPPIDIQPGRLVIMIDENQPSMNWKMARIHQLHPGNDGVTRVVTLKTAKGYTKRAINKICLLPITTDPADEQKTSEM